MAEGPRLTPFEKEDTELEGEKVDWDVTFISMFHGMRKSPSRSTDSTICVINIDFERH